VASVDSSHLDLRRKANNQNYWQDLLAKAFELVVHIA